MVKSITLFFSNGSSDKVYKASIEETLGGRLVNFAYGRKGSTLRTGTKTQSPVTPEKAEAIYDKLVKSKTSKGYTEQTDGETYTSVSRDDDKSGFSCQLLNPITIDELDKKVKTNKYIMQRKYDGVRLSIESKAETKGINRKGLYVGASSTIIQGHCELKEDNKATSMLIDGEGLGDKHAVFDIVELNGECLKSKPYSERFEILTKLMEKYNGTTLFLSESTTSDFETMIQTGRDSKWEGVVIKEASAKYEPGRPSSYGTQLKFKFYKTASVIVEKINEKRSVAMSILDGTKRTPIGNVTIPVNAEIPKANDIIEVRYLYAMPSNALYQPTYNMPRNDIDEAECLISQLEYKGKY